MNYTVLVKKLFVKVGGYDWQFVHCLWFSCMIMNKLKYSQLDGTKGMHDSSLSMTDIVDHPHIHLHSPQTKSQALYLSMLSLSHISYIQGSKTRSSSHYLTS